MSSKPRRDSGRLSSDHAALQSGQRRIEKCNVRAEPLSAANRYCYRTSAEQVANLATHHS